MTDVAQHTQPDSMDGWFYPPNQFFIEPPIFCLSLPEQFAGCMPWDVIGSEIASLGGELIGNVHFNNHSISLTFPHQTIGTSLRKARVARRRLMKKLKLHEQPCWSISTFTLIEYRDFVTNISQNQSHPDYFKIMSDYIRYQTEDGFMKLNRQRVRYLSNRRRQMKDKNQLPSSTS